MIRRESVEVPFSQIDLGARARKVYEGIEKLAESIDRHGLLNRLNVKRQEGDKPYLLMAGGRRYRALEFLKAETVPVDLWPADITSLEAKYIELIESIQREGLTWQEEVALTDEIRKLEFGDKPATIEATADLLHKSVGSISNDIKLARAVKKVPDLANCKTKSDAMKVLNRAEEKVLQREAARRAESKLSSKGIDRVRKNMIDGFVIGDFFEKVHKIPDKSMNLVSLDPDYAIDFTNERKTTQGRFQADYNDTPIETYQDYMRVVLTECFRVLKDPGWLTLWHSTTHAQMLYETMLEVGFDAKRHPLIWIKPGKSGRVSNPTNTFTVDYECCLYARKGMANLTQQGPSSIFTYPSVRDNIHPTEKPIPLLEDLFKLFCDAGSAIFVPFLGSGNDIIAATNVGMMAVGFELSETFKDAFTLRVMKWEQVKKEKF